MKIIAYLILFSFCSIGLAQNIDVQKYHIDLTIGDESDSIQVHEKIQVLFKGNTEKFHLDLASIDAQGRGMKVLSVKENELETPFTHENNSLLISTKKGVESNVMMYEITFTGIPQDGLVIGQNKYKSRTVFADNWPNRAHNWFACVDHPSDKAAVHYTVTAPKHYDCVANGRLIQKRAKNQNQNSFIFDSDILLPTKVMVIGLAKLKFQNIEFPDLKVISAVYPEDEAKGFHDMQSAKYPLEFFIEQIGPYPFEELYNVQSTTRFGGMENAGCIFYDEHAITGEGTMDNLIAHEIAHQWFGNSVTEANWEDLWLSEGFATYFTNLVIENRHGRSEMNKQLINDRRKIIGFSKVGILPVVDTISTDLMNLLNPNSYQKGAWFLHMLRYKVGDEAFWNGIRNYYSEYKYKNASTEDFMRSMQISTKTPLESFFNQWLRTAGHPVLKAKLTKKNRFEIQQTQSNHIFNFPLEVKLNFTNGESDLVKINVMSDLTTFKTNDKRIIQSIELDPNVNLLFEESK